MHLSRLLLATAVAGTMLSSAAIAAPSTLFSNISNPSAEGVPSGTYNPAGSLFDNGQNNGTTSLASQNSTGTNTARSADDFTIPAGECASGEFDISLIRIHMVQADAAAQAFAVDIYSDNGTGTSPSAGINPIATFPETSQTSLGPFGAGTSMFEVAIDTTDMLTLQADTVYWISGFGSNAATNPAGFNNFFAASDGAPGTTANGMLIAPGAGVPNWTLAGPVIGQPDLAFSFAIDGECHVEEGEPEPQPTLEPVFAQVPANGNYSLALLSLLLGTAAWFGLKRKS